jgi:diadenosine tetraphosphate (Ap4A) HIT family hydrolase
MTDDERPQQDPTPLPDCYTCSQESRLATAPAAEKVHVGEFWRVALAVGSALPGWVVVVPRRHVISLAELTDAEALELGPLLIKVSRALEAVTGTEKVYLMQFAEAEGFAHVHVHVTPRSPDPEHRGPRVFAYLNRPDAKTPAEQEPLALRLRDALALA